MLSHLRLLSESCWLVDTHFFPSPYHFLAPRTQGTAQSTPSTFCCSLWHTTIITWSLPVLENQVHSGKNTSNLSHCAICLWLLCRATPLWHADCVESLLYCSQPMRYCVEPLALYWTTCASYATCHLTKHTPLVFFLTRDLLCLFPSRVLSSITPYLFPLSWVLSLSFSLSLFHPFSLFLSAFPPLFVFEVFSGENSVWPIRTRTVTRKKRPKHIVRSSGVVRHRRTRTWWIFSTPWLSTTQWSAVLATIFIVPTFSAKTSIVCLYTNINRPFVFSILRIPSHH